MRSDGRVLNDRNPSFISRIYFVSFVVTAFFGSFFCPRFFCLSLKLHRVAVKQRGLSASGRQPKYGMTTDFTDDTDKYFRIRVIREIRGLFLLIPKNVHCSVSI
jgi:hypothetical protein